MVRVSAGLLVMAVVVLGAASPAQAAGVTGDVSLGLGATQTSTSYGFFNGSSGGFISYDDAEFAVMLPALSLGASLTKTTALGARVSNFWYVPEDAEVVGGYFGTDVSYLHESGFLLAGGVGLLLTGETFEGDAEAGIGSDLRLGYLPFLDPHHGLGFFAEFIPGVVDGDFTYSAGGGLIWIGR